MRTNLVDRLYEMMSKSVSDEKIIEGVTLTESGYAKAARRLGIDPSEVAPLLGVLASRLRQEHLIESEMSEAIGGAERFSFEKDYQQNVVVRDNRTGKSARLRGSEAAALLNRLKAGADEQQTLARYAGRMVEAERPRAMSWEDEDHDREAPHHAALERTGFYGEQGAGCIVVAQDTGRVLIALRSSEVMEPGTWGNWGGAVDQGVTPEKHALREFFEETGYSGPISAVKPLFVFKKDGFQYSNFLVMVPKEFTPHLNWEADDFKWCVFGKWPNPLHFGLKALFGDSASMTAIQAAASRRPVHESVKIDEDEDSFHNEIHSAHGAYNFPWRSNGQKGHGTARFKGRGSHQMDIKLLSIRDDEGEEVEVDEAMKQHIHEQAIAFIGNE